MEVTKGMEADFGSKTRFLVVDLEMLQMEFIFPYRSKRKISAIKSIKMLLIVVFSSSWADKLISLLRFKEKRRECLKDFLIDIKPTATLPVRTKKNTKDICLGSYSINI